GCDTSHFALSKAHSEPDGCFSPFSEVNHSASRTFTTNQPSAAGARPEPESSSGASGTARVYEVSGGGGRGGLQLFAELRPLHQLAVARFDLQLVVLHEHLAAQ